MAKKLLVELGASRFLLPWTAELDSTFQVIGVVRQGLEYGQLVVSSTGEYLQVNGSVMRPLNAAKVRAAIRNAEGRQRVHWRQPMPDQAPPPAPVVIIRKRRRVPAPV